MYGLGIFCLRVGSDLYEYLFIFIDHDAAKKKEVNRALDAMKTAF